MKKETHFKNYLKSELHLNELEFKDITFTNEFAFNGDEALFGLDYFNGYFTIFDHEGDEIAELHADVMESIFPRLKEAFTCQDCNDEGYTESCHAGEDYLNDCTAEECLHESRIFKI